MAFVSTGDPRFTLGDSRPIYEQLVAPHKRMIDDVLLRRGRTSPPDDCVQTSVTWRKTQSSITKYVLDTERSPTPDTSPSAEDAHPPNGPSNRPDTPRTHHRARGLRS